MKQAFMTMMSSDLRQPLSKISEDIGKLLGPLEKELSAKALSHLDSASKIIGRLLLLVNDLLQMTELPRGALEAARCQCKVNEFLLRTTQDLEGLAKKSNINFALECCADEWYVDPNRIMQVLINLGSNAIKFSPEASTVVLRATPAGQFVEVQVIDQGRGVPESQQSSIFEKFTQVEAADGKRKAGTGLGLPICKEIIEANAGELGVRSSSQGQGSTFWFKVPTDEATFREELRKRERLIQKERIPEEPDHEMLQTMQEPGPRTLGTNLTLMQKGLVLIVIPLIFEIFFVFSIYTVLVQTGQSQLEEQHERQIASTAYKLEEAFIAAGQLVVRHRSLQSWQLYDQVCSQILTTREELRRFVQDDAAERSQFNAVDRILSKLEALIKHGRAIISSGFTVDKADEAIIDRCQMWAFAIGSSQRLGKLIDEAERKQFTNPVKQTELRRQQGLLLLLGLFGSALLSFMLARFFSMDITSRLAAQADNAGRLARDLSLNPGIPGSDEIAGLDRSFHETAEKLAEARRKERAVFDNSKDLICILDADALFRGTNPSGIHMLGFAPEELAARSLYDLLAEDERDSVRQILSQDMSSGKSLELRLLRGDGKSVYVELSLCRPQGQDCVYCVGHDISDRKELEQIKQDLLSIVSHDLRSPLSAHDCYSRAHRGRSHRNSWRGSPPGRTRHHSPG